MFRKLLLAAAVVGGLMFAGSQSADAGWRRGYWGGYGGYYAAPVYGGYGYYGPRRFYRRAYYAPVMNYGGYGYGYPGYYTSYPAYYGGYGYYGPAAGVQVGVGPYGGVWVR